MRGGAVSYRDFKFPGVTDELGLTLDNTRLFPDVAPLVPRPDLVDTLNRGVKFARAIATEKARSELLVSPLLLELMAVVQDRYSYFSGVEFNVDPARGLNGYCDFLIARSPVLFLVDAPVVAVAVAKNDDVLTGFGQHIAGMRAAWTFNQNKGKPVRQVFGASTTGTEWKFLRLRDTALTIDLDTYSIAEPGRILAVLLHMIETA